MQVLTDLKGRGVSDILICCVDGLTGFPEAIEAIFPKTTVQTCIVHLIRNSLKYGPAAGCFGSSAIGRALCFGCASRSSRARLGGLRGPRRW